MIDDLLKNPALFIEMVRPQGVILAYVFGSQAEGRAGVSSDLDLAVLLDGNLSHAECDNQRLVLSNLFTEFFNRDDVDVVILNHAAPTLAMEVIKHGKLIYEDAERLPAVDFAARTITRYADAEHLRNLKRMYLEEWIERNKCKTSLQDMSESKVS